MRFLKASNFQALWHNGSQISDGFLYIDGSLAHYIYLTVMNKIRVIL